MYSFSSSLLLLLLLVSLTSVESFGIPGFSLPKQKTSAPNRQPAPPATIVAPKAPKTLERPRIRVIESAEDYLEFLGEDDRLCVVKFYASWCKSCQKFGVMYKRLAYQQGDLFDPSGDITKTGNVRFAEIEFSANARLCRTLGIKKLPNVHLYKGTVGRVAGFPCGPNKFPILQDNIDRFLTMSDDDLTLEKKLEEGGELADQIVTELQQEHLQALQEGEDASL